MGNHTARDYLAIQASAIASEHTFSSASITGTDQRNRLLPSTFEALQVLKSAYHNGQLSAADDAENSQLQTWTVWGEVDTLNDSAF
jgi:hypothetical protein